MMAMVFQIYLTAYPDRNYLSAYNVPDVIPYGYILNFLRMTFEQAILKANLDTPNLAVFYYFDNPDILKEIEDVLGFKFSVRTEGENPMYTATTEVPYSLIDSFLSPRSTVAYYASPSSLVEELSCNN